VYALAESISELLGVPIPERGVNAMLRCPLHEDRSPSFSIHLEEGLWHCFGCEQSGNITQLYRLMGEEVSRDVRLAQAKKRADAPDIESHDFSPMANAYVRELQHPSCFISDYCKSRGISEAAVERFSLGYDPIRDAITFPYTDAEGRVTGIKYRYRSGFKASESGSLYGIYGLENVVGFATVLIAEGESDTLSTFSRYGSRTDMGICGTSGASVSESQWLKFSVSLLFAKTIYLAYDGDAAGDKCAETAMRVLGDERTRRLRPPDDTDLSEFYMGGGRLEDIGLDG
jgi:DNA primase